MAAEVFVTFIFFFAVMAFTAVLFVFWTIASVLKGIFFIGKTVIGGAGGAGKAPPTAPVAECGRPKCGAMNPVGARFCRRCGLPMALSGRGRVRKVAMW